MLAGSNYCVVLVSKIMNELHTNLYFRNLACFVFFVRVWLNSMQILKKILTLQTLA